MPYFPPAPTLSGLQLADADLDALAALPTQPWGRDWLTLASDSAARTALSLVPGTHVQASDADLDAIAGLTTTGLIDRTGAGTATTRTTGTTGLNVLAAANEAAARTAIGAASRNSILAAYNFGTWHPANLSFAETPAPSTGTQIDNDYVSFSNSGGLLTITLDVAGSYFFSVLTTSNHGASFSAARIKFELGGTATLGTLAGWYNNNGAPSWDLASTTSFSAAGTVGQNVTIRPLYEVSGSASVVHHFARCAVSVLFCGV